MADECQHDAACQAVAAVCGESDEGGNNSCRFGLYCIVQHTQIRFSALCQWQQFACLLRLGLLHLVEFTARGKPKRMRAVQRDAVQGGTWATAALLQIVSACACDSRQRVPVGCSAFRSAAQLLTLNPKPDPYPNPYPAAQRRMRQCRSLLSDFYYWAIKQRPANRNWGWSQCLVGYTKVVAMPPLRTLTSNNSGSGHPEDISVSKHRRPSGRVLFSSPFTRTATCHGCRLCAISLHV